MSFLSEIKEKRGTLKNTETIVTSMQGQRYIQCNTTQDTKFLGQTFGFVVDTAPDNVPVMIVNNLYIGSQDCTERSVLDSFNINHVLSLGVNPEIQNVNHKFVQCLDLPETDIKPVLLESLPFIRHGIEKKENVLVHCNAGVSRTAMVACGYLMTYKDMDYPIAYKLIKDKRPCVHINQGFNNQLLLLNSIQFAKLLPPFILDPSDSDPLDNEKRS